MNGNIRLIHSLLPTTVDIRASIPENHPSTRNLGNERSGSGTIVDPEGYVLTVHYVVLGAATITVTTADGEQFPAKLTAQDFETGLALLKIPGRDLPYLKPAAPNSIALGYPAVIVASSGDTGRRVSGGYVTSLESYDGHWEYMLERTIRLSAFNPGFGGGTLANFRGELLGVVSLNLNDVAKFSLAIPIECYLQHEDELKLHGRVRSRAPRSWLGFYPQPLGGHIIVAGIVPGSPADRGGLREGDIILLVENTEIRSRPELYQEIWKKRPGERISLRVFRDEQSIDLALTGGDRWGFYGS